jgi:type IV pilus assembly protein PilM
MPSLPRQLARKRTPEGAHAPTPTSERRSAKSLASMDVGELVRLVRLPRLPQRQGGSTRAARSGQRPVVGVDLEPGFLAAAEVSVNNGTLAIERAAGVTLAPDVIRDGEVVDAVALSVALRELFAEHKFDRRVRLGIANQRIVVRMLELPPITNPAELDAAVRFQAQDELPMSLDSAVLDYYQLGVHETPSGPRQHVVLVAARREMVERLVSAAHEAGLRPVGVDLAAFALIRALRSPQAPDDERVAYLSAGGLGNLAVAQGSTCSFTRVLSVGLESIAGDLAERLGVAAGDARDLLMRADVGEAPEAPEAQPTDGGLPSFDLEGEGALTGALAEQPTASAAGEPRSIAQDVFADGVRRIAVEIRNSLHYHSMHGVDQAVTRLVVSGAMIEIPGFVEMLRRELELEVEIGKVHEARPGALGGVSAGRIAVAAGLAVSERPA